ncbi:MAG: GNAT family N-acetyltransferase [Pseudomonadota bacterium]
MSEPFANRPAGAEPRGHKPLSGPFPPAGAQGETLLEVGPEDQLWRELLDHAPQATVFHRPEWARVLQSTYGLRPRYFVLSRKNRRPLAGIPFFETRGLLRRRLISLPFSDVAGPLLVSPHYLEPLVGAVVETAAAEGIGRLDIRGNCPEAPPAFGRSDDFCTFFLDLTADLPTLRGRLQKSTIQRSLRIGEKGPLRVRVGNIEADMAAFHRLNLLTRRVHGVPPQPYRFFRQMWAIMHSAGAMTLLLAELSGQPVAGMVLFHSGNTAYYKYGASDPRYLRLRCNHLLMWRAMEWSKERGCSTLDLGRTYLGNEGLMRYKRSWGARQTPLTYWQYPPSKGQGLLAEGTRAYRLLTRCWRRLPLWATELGGTLYKHFT